MLKLYVFAGCPYCIKVLRAFDSMGVKYEIINAQRGTPGNAELIKLGGKSQAPFMVDEANNIMMYESDDIIAYAQEHIA